MMNTRLYMVIEHFRNGDAVPVYRRFRERGRLAPEGLRYVSSWVHADLGCCYQLMETEDPKLLDEWMARWADLVDFEVHAVIPSDEAARKIAPLLGADAPVHERIEDPEFRRAVDLLDAGDVEGLRAHLRRRPGLVRQRVVFEGLGYFGNPSLLEFTAENPVRHGKLPPEIVEVARVILEAGADAGAVNGTLGLVCSGRVARECGAQIPLIGLLCQFGADPNCGLTPAITHGEFDAAGELIRRGARIDLPVAAALGRVEDARAMLANAGAEERHRALALAAQFGRTDIVEMLLEAGEDPNRFNPAGYHSHSTPLHQAAWGGYTEVVRLLVERGAHLDVKDTVWQGTPEGWAAHAGKAEVAEYLRRRREQRK